MFKKIFVLLVFLMSVFSFPKAQAELDPRPFNITSGLSLISTGAALIGVGEPIGGGTTVAAGIYQIITSDEDRWKAQARLEFAEDDMKDYLLTGKMTDLLAELVDQIKAQAEEARMADIAQAPHTDIIQGMYLVRIEQKIQ